MDFLNKKNVTTISAYISENPFSQTVLQLSKPLLTLKVRGKINELLEKKCTSIFIYCNSLSSALDLEDLRSHFNIPLLTPIETYCLVSKKEQSIALIAANCQALGNIEKIILKQDPHSILTGFSSLVMVDSIEKGLSPQEIIKKYDLLLLCRLFQRSGSKIIMLGCTHFSYFYNELMKQLIENKISIQLFDPSEIMFQNLLLTNNY